MTVSGKWSRLACGLVLLALGISEALAVSGREQMDAFLDGLVTLRADFRQQVWGSGQDQRSSGTLYLQRPGRFRWDYRTPDQSIIADGRRIWLDDRELEQVSFQSQAKALKGTPALLLLDTGPLDRHFEIREMGAQSRGLYWVELVPREQETEFTRILVGFADNQLRELEMTDNFGQVTRFDFDDVQRNPEIDPALFEFHPKQGMDVFGD